MRKLFNVISLLFVLGAVIFLWLAYQSHLPFEKAKGENQALKEVAVQSQDNQEDPMERSIDFSALKKINPDIIGWIYIPNTSIDYPVLKGDQYLYRNFKGARSQTGSLFTFTDTSEDFSEIHTCIFGHNMNVNQLFGELKAYRNIDFAKSHSNVYLYTPMKTCCYEVFSIFDCWKTDPVFNCHQDKNSDSYKQLVQNMISSSVFMMNIKDAELIWEKQTLTLATCSNYTRTAKRFTVNAVETKTIYHNFQ